MHRNLIFRDVPERLLVFSAWPDEVNVPDPAQRCDFTATSHAFSVLLFGPNDRYWRRIVSDVQMLVGNYSGLSSMLQSYVSAHPSPQLDFQGDIP